MSEPTFTRRLGLAAPLAVAWALVPAVGGFLLVAQLGAVADALRSIGPAAVLVFIGCFAATSGLGLLPTYAQSVLAGWMFGAVQGTLAAVAGLSVGALVGFVAARVLSHDRVAAAIDAHPRAAAVRAALLAHGPVRTTFIVALLRLPPNSPFALTNLALAGGGAKPMPFLLGTAVGMTPRTAITAIAAAAAAATGARDVQAFLKDGPGAVVLVSGLVVTVIVLAIIGAIGRKALEAATATGARPADAADA